MNLIGCLVISEYLKPIVRKGAARPFFSQFPNSSGETILTTASATFTPTRTTDAWLLFTDFQLSVTAAPMTSVLFTVQTNSQPFAPFVNLILPPTNNATGLPGTNSAMLSNTPMVFGPNVMPSFKITNNFADTILVWLTVWGYFWSGHNEAPELKNLFYGDAINGI